MYWNKLSIFQEVNKTGTQVFENSVLQKITGLWRKKQQEAWEDWKMSSFMIRTPHQILLGWPHEEWWDVHGMGYIWGRREGTKGFVQKTEGQRPLWRTRQRLATILIWIWQKQGKMAWTGFIRLRICANGRFQRTWQWTIWFHKMWEDFLTSFGTADFFRRTLPHGLVH